MSEYVIYDLESYPNIFTYCAVDSDGNNIRVYEISDRKNQTEELLQELRNLKINKSTMVGFNSFAAFISSSSLSASFFCSALCFAITSFILTFVG